MSLFGSPPKLPEMASAPASPERGIMYVGTDGVVRWYSGTAWIAVADAAHGHTPASIGAAAASHAHAAADTTSGTFADARIPNLNTSKLTAGTLPVARGGTGQASVAAGSYLQGNGTGAMNVRSPAQVLSDIGGVGNTDPRLTDSRTPTGAAGGALAGSYPNPDIAAGSVNLTHLLFGSLDNLIHKPNFLDGLAYPWNPNSQAHLFSVVNPTTDTADLGADSFDAYTGMYAGKWLGGVGQTSTRYIYSSNINNNDGLAIPVRPGEWIRVTVFIRKRLNADVNLTRLAMFYRTATGASAQGVATGSNLSAPFGSWGILTHAFQVPDNEAISFAIPTIRFDNNNHENPIYFDTVIVRKMSETDDIANLAVTNAKIAADINASKIAAGVLADARIPNLNTSKLTAGTLPVARGGTGVATVASGSFLTGAGTGAMVARTPAQVLGDIGGAAASHGHDASDINAGTLGVDRIPDLAVGKIIGLQAALDGKAPSSHAHAASDVSSGVLDVARVPDLPISKVTGLQQALESIEIVNVASSRALLLTDPGKMLEANSASALAITIPTNAAVAIPIGSSVAIRRQGVGQVSIVAASGVTIRSIGGVPLASQYSEILLHKRAANEWVLQGSSPDLTALFLTLSGGTVTGPMAVEGQTTFRGAGARLVFDGTGAGLFQAFYRSGILGGRTGYVGHGSGASNNIMVAAEQGGSVMLIGNTILANGVQIGDDTGWINPPSLNNGWSILSSNYPVSYRRVNGVVFVRGVIAGGTPSSATDVFTLPVGFRPGSWQIWPCFCSGGALGRNSTYVSGGVRAHSGGNNAYWPLDGITFVAEN